MTHPACSHTGHRKTSYPLHSPKKYTFCSLAHGNFSKIVHILRHKTYLYTFKKTETTPCTVSDHNEMKLKINSKQIPSKYISTQRLSNPLLNDEWVKEKIQTIKNVPGTN